MLWRMRYRHNRWRKSRLAYWAILGPSGIADPKACHAVRRPYPTPLSPAQRLAFPTAPNPRLDAYIDPGRQPGNAIFLAHKLGDIAAPDLIGSWHIKPTVQRVRDIESFYRRSFVNVRAGLFADQTKLAHQATHFESTKLLTVFTHQREDAAAASSATTLREQFIDATTQSKPFNVGCAAPQALGVVARASDVKHLTQPINRLNGAQLINQRERS